MAPSVASAVLPPELQTTCRRLASTNVQQLPAILPILLKDIARCRESLSRPQEANAPSHTADITVLVHKLKTHITSLLNGRVSQGHLVGAALAKAVVECGGWESLRAAGSWVNSLIAILQKKSPAVTKELCVVTLTKIYTLMHHHPTLVREVVTPTLPVFATACLQVLKPAATSKTAKAPYSLVETIFDALSTLLPLHPTTLRNVAAKIRAETRPYLAPTSSDNVITPISLQKASRRLAIRLSMTAAKGGDSTEWTKHVDELVDTFHKTADQVFRAVQESWESSTGYRAKPVDVDSELQGGGMNPDQLTPWSGVQAGSERIIGILDFIGDYLRNHTRVSVTIPITAIADVTSRISSIKPPSRGNAKYDSGQVNSAIGREERDELWTMFPYIQMAAMRLHISMIKRLESSYIPLTQEALDQLLRIFESAYRIPEAREFAYLLAQEILHLSGPTLPKPAVDSLRLLIKCCCRDLQGAAGYLKKPSAQGSDTSQNGQNSKTISQNADAFLPGNAQDDTVSVSLSATHLKAAGGLLTTLFSRLPQQHIPSSSRSHMVKTAILSRNQDAQVASILHPARDRNGRTPQVALPYLIQQFPHDEKVEILRFSFRPLAAGTSTDFMQGDDNMDVEDNEEDSNANMTNNTGAFGQTFNGQFSSSFTPPAPTVALRPSIPTGEQAGPTPFLAQPSETITHSPKTVMMQTSSPPTSSLKRRNEDAMEDTGVSKRVELDTVRISTSGAVQDGAASMSTTVTAAQAPATLTSQTKPNTQDEDEDSDDESVHLNMEMDSDSDDGEDDE
ncbi:rRNA processing/ribosome biogenesis-domain-containing protein [Xylariaceae sp. FL1272]|nr:rRNA processing/ribosome biogenesis-domain-containing protein [Xylariaceae sp. FL1272]